MGDGRIVGVTWPTGGSRLSKHETDERPSCESDQGEVLPWLSIRTSLQSKPGVEKSDYITSLINRLGFREVRPAST